MIPPGKIAPGNKQGFWLTKLLAFCMSLVLQNGIGYRVKRTPTGTIIELDDRGGGGKEGPIWV